MASLDLKYEKDYTFPMIIYDQVSIAFIQKSETIFKEILTDLGITVRRSRFLWKKYLFPIHVVVFEGSELGHFNAPYLQIGLNRKLIYEAKDSVLRDIIKHELAHYLTYLEYGQVSHHGAEFKSTCERFGFPFEISRATMNLSHANEAKVGDLDSERVLEKVKKLLQLAQSSNVHEAELATVKANELLLRHNLERVKKEDEPIYLDRILMRPRKDAKLSAIYDILRHFVVKPVISMGKHTCCLEVSGSKTNVELARYVGEFLERELDHLWEEARKEFGLTGLRAKNSFFVGVAKGFDQKMTRAKCNFSEADQKALVVVEQKLAHDTSVIYRRLTHASSGARVDGAARDIGVLKGKDLTIRKGVESSSHKTLFLT